MPTVLANALLSFVPDRSLPVRGPDRVGVVSPMYDEEAGAGPALDSLLSQTEAIDELAVSVNGGGDGTADVVRATLAAHGYRKVYGAPAPDFRGELERWHRDEGPSALLLLHSQPISKADSINVAIEGGYVTSERVLVVDGDTIFAPTFVERLKDEFYRLRRERAQGAWRYVIEDSALQSGSVTSLRPPEGGPAAAHISRARSGEYAVATLLRAGQTARLGSGRLLGQSRLYTVVGCGFAARRSSFPMPADTLTEDHDFTLQVQNERTTERRMGVAELQARGFRVRSAAGLVDAADYFDPQDELVLRRGSNARFVAGALMYTEDPINLSGYMHQVERWNGGGVENAIKRVRGAVRPRMQPNVAFAALGAQFENLFGIALLLLLLPVALGVNSALPGYGTALAGLLAWLGFDLLVTTVLVLLGFSRIWRGQGLRGWRLVRRTASSTLGSSLQLLSMRPFNAVAYLVALTRASRSAWKAPELDPRATITWERPRAITNKGVGLRLGKVSLGLLLTVSSLFLGASYVANGMRPGYKETWLLIHAGSPMVAEEHVELPLVNVMKLVDPRSATEGAELTDAEPGQGGEPGAGGPEGSLAEAPPPGDGSSANLSAFCSVAFTATPAGERRRRPRSGAAWRATPPPTSPSRTGSA